MAGAAARSRAVSLQLEEHTLVPSSALVSPPSPSPPHPRCWDLGAAQPLSSLSSLPQDNEVYDKPPSVHYGGSQHPLQPRGPLHPLRNHSPPPTARPWRGDEVVANQHRLPQPPLLQQHELLNSYYVQRRPEPAPVAAHVHQDFQPAVSAPG